MLTYAAATIRSNKRMTLFILVLQFVRQCLLWGSDFFLLEAFFGANVFGSVTCIEQQGDKKYHSKYKGEGTHLLEALRFPILLCKLVPIYYLQVLDFNVFKKT